MPVEAVWQVKLKLLPSSTVPEALLVMVGVWGTTAQKCNKHRLFHIQALQPYTYTHRTHVRTHASHFSPTYTCHQSTSNATLSLQMLTTKPLPPIPSQMLKNKRNQNKSLLFTSFLFPLGTTSGPRLALQPVTFHLTPLHTPTSSPSPATVPCPKTLYSHCTLTVTHWTHTLDPHTRANTHTHTHTHTPQIDLFVSPVNVTVLLLTSDVSPLKVTLQV